MVILSAIDSLLLHLVLFRESIGVGVVKFEHGGRCFVSSLEEPLARTFLANVATSFNAAFFSVPVAISNFSAASVKFSL